MISIALSDYLKLGTVCSIFTNIRITSINRALVGLSNIKFKLYIKKQIEDIVIYNNNKHNNSFICWGHLKDNYRKSYHGNWKVNFY